MSKSATINDLYNVEKSLEWARALQKTIQRVCEMGEMSALEASIPRKVNRLHWLPATIQCLTSCRFSELQEIELEGILKDRVLTIFQKKTKKIRPVPDLFVMNLQDYQHLDVSAKIMHTTYDSYANDLKRSIPLNVLNSLSESANLTHIFRHLRATFMASKGIPLQEIAEYFQHENSAITKQYIHENISFSELITKK